MARLLAFIAALLLAVVLHFAVIHREERFLADRYGADFESYVRATDEADRRAAATLERLVRGA